MRSPRERIQGAMQRLDHLQLSLTQALNRWRPRLAAENELRRQLAGRLDRAMQTVLKRKSQTLNSLSTHLAAINPDAVLQRGYSIVTHGKNGRVIKDSNQIRNNDLVRIRSAGGNWRALALTSEEDLFDLSNDNQIG